MVLEGTTNAQGDPINGLGEEALTENPEMVLAMYDKMAGAIIGRDGAKVKLGSFYDFKKRAPRATPEISYTFRINGERVEMKEGDDEPLEVKAAKLAGAVKKAKKSK